MSIEPINSRKLGKYAIHWATSGGNFLHSAGQWKSPCGYCISRGKEGYRLTSIYVTGYVDFPTLIDAQEMAAKWKFQLLVKLGVNDWSNT